MQTHVSLKIWVLTNLTATVSIFINYITQITQVHELSLIVATSPNYYLILVHQFTTSSTCIICIYMFGNPVNNNVCNNMYKCTDDSSIVTSTIWLLAGIHLLKYDDAD